MFVMANNKMLFHIFRTSSIEVKYELDKSN